MQNGALQRFRLGVYVVPSVAPEDVVLFAAGLAWPTGAVCRSTAAQRIGLPVESNGLRFLVPHGQRSKIEGLNLHETHSLPADHVIKLGNLAVTSGARTLCDIAPDFFPAQMRHITEVALTSRATTQDELLAVIDNRHRRGVRGLKAFYEVVGEMTDDDPYPESILEVDMEKGFAEIGLCGMRRQAKPPWYDGRRGIVDWDDELGGKTIVEAGGRTFRQVTQAHDNDRQRNRIAAAGTERTALEGCQKRIRGGLGPWLLRLRV